MGTAITPISKVIIFNCFQELIVSEFCFLFCLPACLCFKGRTYSKTRPDVFSSCEWLWWGWSAVRLTDLAHLARKSPCSVSWSKHNLDAGGNLKKSPLGQNFLLSCWKGKTEQLFSFCGHDLSGNRSPARIPLSSPTPSPSSCYLKTPLSLYFSIAADTAWS